MHWRPIPAQNVHGILRSYHVRVTPVKLADGTNLNGEPEVVIVSNDTLSTVIDGLNRYTTYRIEIWGETIKGEGPAAITYAGTLPITQSCLRSPDRKATCLREQCFL